MSHTPLTCPFCGAHTTMKGPCDRCLMLGKVPQESEWSSDIPTKSGWYFLAPLGDIKNWEIIEIITGMSEFIIKNGVKFNYIRDFPLALWQGPIGV